MKKLSFSMLIICFWGMAALLSFVFPQTLMMYICCLVGGLGIIYCICFLWKLFVKPIERDLIIAKGNYLWKVCFLVIVIPFSLTLIMEVVNKVDKRYFSPEKLVYDENWIEKDKLANMPKAESPTLFWSVYYHFVDPGNQHMAARTMIGCVSAAIIAILGIFLLNGLLVSSIIGWIDKRKEKWQEGQIRYGLRHLGRNRFAIVIGANEISATVIKNLLTTKSVDDINFKSEGTNNYVILHTKREVQMVREFLSSHLSSEMLDKVIIYNGLRDSKRELERLCLAYSTEIYVLGESEILDGGENYHDATNMQCVNLIADILETEKIKKDNNPPLKKKICKVLFDYQTTFSIFQFSDIPSNVKNNLVFIPFSRYEAWARKVIVDGYCYLENSQTLIDYIPLDGQGLEQDSDKHVHFVIVGMSKMGIAMGVQAMLQCHYLNYKKTRTRITFIDTNADKEMAFLKGHYYNAFELTRHRYIDTDNQEGLSSEWIDPIEFEGSKWKHLSSKGKNFIDVELEFIKGEVESDGVREYLKQISNDSQSKLTIAICLTQTHQAVAASLYLPIDVYKSESLQQIWVYQRESADIIMNLYNTQQADLRYKKLRPFGMLYGEYMTDRKVYLKALLANGAYVWNGENNKADEMNMAVKSTYKELRDKWKTLIIEHKWSNKYFVDSIYLKLRSVLRNQLSISDTTYGWENLLKKENILKILQEALTVNEEILAECEHNRWVMQQLIMGFNPCNATQDHELSVLNKALKEVGHKKTSTEYDMRLQRFKKCKDEYKNTPERIHPNICSYEHLDDVDYQAKSYDKFLNSAIPSILILVDGHGIIK